MVLDLPQTGHQLACCQATNSLVTDASARCADAARCNARGNRQIAQCRFSIRFGHVRYVLALDCVHEALCHAIAPRGTHRRSPQQANLADKQARLLCNIC